MVLTLLPGRAAGIQPHPRLLLDGKSVKNYTKRAQGDSLVLMMHQGVILSANNAIPAKDITKPSQAYRRLLPLAYAWLTTGEEKYAVKAERDLLTLARMEEWWAVRDIEQAEILMSAAIAYDWCYDKLSPESRKLVSSAIREKGLEPVAQSKAIWQTAGGYENQVCNAGLAIAAAAIWEQDPAYASGLLQQALKSIALSYPLYEPDGAWPEGYGAYVSGSSWSALMLSCLESSKIPEFKPSRSDYAPMLKSARYSIQMVTPNYYTFSFGDYAVRGAVQFIQLWLYDKSSEPSLLFVPARTLQRDKDHNFIKDPMLPLTTALAVKNGIRITDGAAPVEDITFMSGGTTPIAIFRSHWASPKKCLYAGLKGGSPSTPHNHQDCGSFYFEASGVRWATDLGSESEQQMLREGIIPSDQSQDAEKWKLFRYGIFSHNVPILNDKPQVVDGKAVIVKDETVDNRRSVVADLSSLYPEAQSVERALSMVGRSYILVQDRIVTGSTPVHLRWNMTSMATNLIPVDAETARLERSGAVLYMTVLSEVPVSYNVWSANPENRLENPNKSIQCVGFEADLAPGKTYEFSVYLSPDKKINIAQRKYYRF